jgi:hypothetical protein
MEKSLDKSVDDIQMGTMEDVPLVSSCRIMVGKVEMILTLGKNYWGASIALRHTGVSKDLIIRLNDSGKTFDEIADYLDN